MFISHFQSLNEAQQIEMIEVVANQHFRNMVHAEIDEIETTMSSMTVSADVHEFALQYSKYEARRQCLLDLLEMLQIAHRKLIERIEDHTNVHIDA